MTAGRLRGYTATASFFDRLIWKTHVRKKESFRMKSLHHTVDHSSEHSKTTYRWLAVVVAAIMLAACQPVHPEAATSSASMTEATAEPAEEATAEVAEEATAEPAEEAAAEDSAEIPQITIKAQDFAFDMPDEVPSGLVSITFTA